MPSVSVIVPTYNRRETILRCLESIRGQSFEDWEALVVDDGSQDGTAELIDGFDPRVRLIRQDNQGISGARNTGLIQSKGDYLAFLDSDDAWLPHHLELLVGYLRAHPDRPFVSAEFWEDFGPDRIDKHYRIELGEWYVELADRIGSCALNLPENEDDPYMRVYSKREPIGEWGRAVVAAAGHPDALLYRGDLYRHWRWGYLMAMQTTVLTRAAFERVGLFDMRFRNISDHGFIAQLCRHYEASFLSLPTAIKHEYDDAGELPVEDHLSTGKHRLSAAREILLWFEELHLAETPNDLELRRLHAYRRFWLARMLTLEDRPEEARALLVGVSEALPGLWEARLLSACLAALPGRRTPGRVASAATDTLLRLGNLRARLL